MRAVVLTAALFLASGAAGAAELKSAPVELREVELTYSSDAVIEAVRQSTVAAQIQGRIVDIRFDVGDYVKKGDVIVRIDERQVGQAAAASAAQVSEAQAALANARATYERTKQLLAQKFVALLCELNIELPSVLFKFCPVRLSILRHLHHFLLVLVL